MEHITVGELLEQLKVADPCARVVIKNNEDTWRTFDVSCVSPVGELVIELPNSSKFADLNEDMKGLEGRMVKASDKVDEIKSLVDEINDLLQ